MREEYMILGEFWTDLGILYLWSFSTLTTRAVYENNVYRQIPPWKDHQQSNKRFSIVLIEVWLDFRIE